MYFRTQANPYAYSRDPHSIYTDGGVIGRNPSEVGGAWAFVVVTETIIYRDRGIVTPKDISLPTVSNNVTELVAALLALETMPISWKGTLYTDSQITQRRLNEGRKAKMNGIPDDIRERVYSVRGLLNYEVKLLAGHPTAEDLARGYRIKDSGNSWPVSKFNVLCDKMCGEAQKAFVQNLTSIGVPQ